VRDEKHKWKRLAPIDYKVIPLHAKKAYGGMEAHLHSFMTSAMNGDNDINNYY